MAIWDCFMFSNELLVLEVRLHELYEHVDRFVLVEATRAFNGRPKPLVFAENRARFAPFLDKLVHVVVDDLPPLQGDAWVLENFQRNAILRGLDGAASDDLIMVSDADEIPRATSIAKFQGPISVVENRIYYYRFNLQMHNERDRFNSTRMLRRRDLRTPQELRKRKGRQYGWWRLDKPRNLHVIEDGGWHFSYLLDTEGIADKVAASAHQEFAKPEFTDAARIERCIRAGLDLFDRQGRTLERVPIDESYPLWVRQHQAELAPWIA
jgi:hypothetical protein